MRFALDGWRLIDLFVRSVWWVAASSSFVGLCYMIYQRENDGRREFVTMETPIPRKARKRERTQAPALSASHLLTLHPSVKFCFCFNWVFAPQSEALYIQQQHDSMYVCMYTHMHVRMYVCCWREGMRERGQAVKWDRRTIYGKRCLTK